MNFKQLCWSVVGRFMHELGSSRWLLMIVVTTGTVFFSLYATNSKVIDGWFNAFYIVLGFYFASKTVGSFSKNGNSHVNEQDLFNGVEKDEC